MSTSEGIEQKAAICGKNERPGDGLHHCLHLIADASQRTMASVLIAAITETLDAAAMERLAKALRTQAEMIAAQDDQTQ